MYSETLDTELKEFNLNLSTLSKDELRKIHENIISGKFWGNHRILISLKDQIQKYFLKYLSGWNHADLDFDFGKLYFGIDDLGEIIGIPYEGELDDKIILSWINSELLKTDLSLHQRNILIEKLKVNIIPIRPRFLNTMELYLENLKKEELKVEFMKDFTKKYSKWYTKMSRYTVKLVDFLNCLETKEELISYIEEHNPDTENKQNIINYLRSKTVWEPLKSGEIKELKIKSTNMYYWLTMFKDLRTLTIKNEKPVMKNFKIINYDNFYCSPKNMNYIFSSNKLIKFYVIRFDIPNLKKEIHVKSKYGNIVYRRKLTELGPCSTPLLSFFN